MQIDYTDVRSRIYKLADGSKNKISMGDEIHLPLMPSVPTLLDFFKYRFDYTQHLLQSAALAQQDGLEEKIILACLLHDIAVSGFIRGDHGYWGRQMVEPYVDEEVSWAIQAHQILRFYPDNSVGYNYPERYKEWFGEDYVVDDYIDKEYEIIKNHKWYMTARMITLYDLYSFDDAKIIDMESFEDILGRNFNQPKEGLGFDNSNSAHIWRSIIRPNKFL